MKKQLSEVDVETETGSRKNPRGSTVKGRTSATSTKNEWSAVQKVRLPHKVGLPLGSGGGGDDGGG
jgi:hypothetical protein